MPVQLYEFQRADVSKLAPQKSRLLGHEMGCGKTVMALVLDRLSRHGDTSGAPLKTLIIVKRRAMRHWVRQIRKVTPELSPDVYTVDRKNRSAFVKVASNQNTPGVFICYWQVLRLMPELRQVQWHHIIADEVHRAGNRKAQQTRALKLLRTTWKTGLSGTAATTNPDSLWSVLNWLHPRVYTSYWRFRRRYCIEEDTWQGYTKIVGVKNLDELHAQMEPWYVRRLKKDVLPELPDKYYTDYVVELDPQQRRAYDQMRKNKIAWVNDAQGREAPIVAGQVVSQLQRLQQFAVSYCIVEQRRKYSRKYEREIVFDAVVMDEPSAKLDAVMEIIEDAGDAQIVVFSQFKQPVYLLGMRLADAGISHGTLTSDTSEEDSDQLEEDFHDGKVQVLVSTIASGGESLDLYMASTVIFLDRAWDPSLNAQAEDRLHRDGQKNAVQVIDIIAANTLDLGRRQGIRLKWSWIKKLLGDKVPEPDELFKEEAGDG